MYGALWRVLPGRWWVRVIILIVLLAAVLAALNWWVFPWIQNLTAPKDVGVTQ